MATTFPLAPATDHAGTYLIASTPAGRILLLTLIVYIPNFIHFLSDVGVTGVNVFNVLLAITLIVAFRERTPPGPPLPFGGRLYAFYAMLVFGLIVSLVRDSDHPLADATELKELLTYSLLSVITYRLVRDFPTARLLLVAICGVTLLASMEAMREAADHASITTKRFGGPFGDPNAAGAYYGIFLPVLLAFCYFARTRMAYRGTALAAFMAGVFALFVSQSRQAYLGLAITTTLLSLLKSFALVLLPLFAIANYTYWAPENVENRVEKTFDGPTARAAREAGATYDTSTEARFVLWSASWEIVQRNPLGVGLNRFKDEMRRYKPDDAWFRATDAHNGFMRVLVELGWIGLLCFFLLLHGLAMVGWRLSRHRSVPEAQFLGYGFLGATIGLVLSNAASSNFFHGVVMGNYWILAGVVARYATLLSQTAPPQHRTALLAVAPPDITWPRDTILGVRIPEAIVVLALLSVLFAARFLVGA